jgi:hypothetical protein
LERRVVAMNKRRAPLSFLVSGCRVLGGSFHLMHRFNPHQRQAIPDYLSDRSGQEQPRAADRRVFRADEAALRTTSTKVMKVPARLDISPACLHAVAGRFTPA